MKTTATLIVNGKSYELPIIEATDGNDAINISGLRRETGFITYDPGFRNTGGCMSAISYTWTVKMESFVIGVFR